MILNTYLKGRYNYSGCFGGGFTGFCLFKMGVRQKIIVNKKQINMDLKEIQNLIKFVANSGVAEVKLEMDDIKITIRTTIEGTATETTYVQQTCS
jgi:hypothetical protein